MIERSLLVATVALLLVPTMADAQEFPLSKDYSGNYLCKVTASGGVRFEKASGKWIPSTFNVDDVSYIVKVIDTGETNKDSYNKRSYRLYNITVKDFEGEIRAKPCFFAAQTDSEDKKKFQISDGAAWCRYFGTEYRFDFETLRMQSMFEGGYMDNEPNTDTPYVAVGKCQRID